MNHEDFEFERSYDAVGRFAILNAFLVLAINMGMFVAAIGITILLTKMGFDDDIEQFVIACSVWVGVLLVFGLNIWFIKQARNDRVQTPILAAMAAYTISAPLCAAFVGTGAPIIFIATSLLKLIN